MARAFGGAGRRSPRWPTPGSFPSCTPSAARAWCARRDLATNARAGGPGTPRRPARPRGARAPEPDRAGARARRARCLARGEAGALLVSPGGRRVHAFCVRTTEPDLPPSDRVAHLLLALRVDEEGFATVANHAFAGAPWRVRRRMPAANATGARRGPPDRPLASTRAHIPPRSRGRPARRLRVGRVGLGLPRAARGGCSALARAGAPRSAGRRLAAARGRFSSSWSPSRTAAFWVCEDGDEMVGYTRVARFGAMDELTELWVAPGTRATASGARCSSAAGPSRRRPSWAAWCSGSARPRTSACSPSSA